MHSFVTSVMLFYLYLQVKNVVKIAKIKYPSDVYDVVWLFDHSPCHTKRAEDALSASVMGVKDGCKQPIMHDTEFLDATGNVCKQQMFVTVNGQKVPKGLRTVLSERGHQVTGLKKETSRMRSL